MTHERLSITSRNWFEYQSRLLSRLLSSCACPPWHRSFPSHVVFPSQVISPLTLIFCFLCLTDLPTHTRIHHVYAFSISHHVGLRVCTSLLQLALNFTCTFTAPASYSFFHVPHCASWTQLHLHFHCASRTIRAKLYQ
jgi:hypothetical protein